MSKLILDNDYTEWVADLSRRYRSSQIKAAVSVNEELLKFYWSLGRDIVERQAENKYGKGFFNTLSRDLKAALPEAKGFSPRNLYYIRNFYGMYNEIMLQIEAKSSIHEFPQAVEKSLVSNLPQAGANLFRLPWGHHKLLIDKYFNQPEIALFYIIKSVENGWSRAMLDHMLDTKLHLRQGKAVSNFNTQMPQPTGELAQELTKDPYIFDFVNLTDAYKEMELKDALISEITRFLLELGEGFAYVGKEYRLKVGDTEQFTDLLFYNLKLRCYCVIEVKVTKFEPGHLGQLSTYVTAVNHLLKTEQDNPTVGLLVCKTKDNVLAQYSLEGYNLPIGISQYQLDKLLPENFKSTLPTIEEIESKLK